MNRIDEGGVSAARTAGRPLVVKIGSSTLTTSESKVDYAFLEDIAAQIASVRAAGWQPIIVTSAAIACGLESLGIERRPTDMPSLQAAASVGQSVLSAAYASAFSHHGITTSLVLLTRRDTADRTAYLHARDTLSRLLELGVVLAPGDFFGPAGAGYARLALVPPLDVCRRAAEVIAAVGSAA